MTLTILRGVVVVVSGGGLFRKTCTGNIGIQMCIYEVHEEMPRKPDIGTLISAYKTLHYKVYAVLDRTNSSHI